jgi:hypothetical protein
VGPAGTPDLTRCPFNFKRRPSVGASAPSASPSVLPRRGLVIVQGSSHSGWHSRGSMATITTEEEKLVNGEIEIVYFVLSEVPALLCPSGITRSPSFTGWHPYGNWNPYHRPEGKALVPHPMFNPFRNPVVPAPAWTWLHPTLHHYMSRSAGLDDHCRHLTFPPVWPHETWLSLHKPSSPVTLT